MRSQLDEALHREHAQRFANRYATDPEAVGQLILRELSAQHQRAEHDLAAHGIEDDLRARLIVDRALRIVSQSAASWRGRSIVDPIYLFNDKRFTAGEPMPY